MTYAGKKVVILGMARQGIALARYLSTHGAHVVINDKRSPDALRDALTALTNVPVRTVMGGHPLDLLNNCDLLCLSGGIPNDLEIVKEAQKRGIPLSNDSQIFMELCPAMLIGITGSAGKTTTTTLTYEMLLASANEANCLRQSANYRVWVGGNIGNPLISDVDQMRPNDRVVMELSSFQLQQITLSPHIACITNITPNHLDRHPDMADYIAAKKRILDDQMPQDWDVLCADDENTRQLAAQPGFSPAKTVWFSVKQTPFGDGAWLDENGDLCLRIAGITDSTSGSQRICHRRDLQLMGEHNILNVLAASALAALGGASLSAIRQVATTFTGVAHRLQMVRVVNGVRYYNDSIATAPERLMAGVRAFPNTQSIILLCGGKDKYLPWDEAVTLIHERCAHVVFFGELGPMVAQKLAAIRPPSALSVVHTLPDAIQKAAELAKSGDVVLLSPGGTSFDAFVDFAERGEKFKEWVNLL